MKFENDPGERFGYSGEGYDYTAKFAQVKAGAPFVRLADRLGEVVSVLYDEPRFAHFIQSMAQ